MIRVSGFLLAVSLPVSAQTADTTERAVAAGAYTEAQATLGETVFAQSCASCHIREDHTGEKFSMNWFGRTVFDYFKLIKSTMPDDNIGGLSDDDYLRVIAYILKANGFVPGADSLAADTVALKRLRIGPAVTDTATRRTRR